MDEDIEYLEEINTSAGQRALTHCGLASNICLPGGWKPGGVGAGVTDSEIRIEFLETARTYSASSVAKIILSQTAMAASHNWWQSLEGHVADLDQGTPQPNPSFVSLS
jgi:hypothetical protein